MTRHFDHYDSWGHDTRPDPVAATSRLANCPLGLDADCSLCDDDHCRQLHRQVRPVLNSDRDYSAAHAFDESRAVPRSALSDEANAAIPWGDHPDDGMFTTVCTACGRDLAARECCMACGDPE